MILKEMFKGLHCLQLFTVLYDNSNYAKYASSQKITVNNQLAMRYWNTIVF